MPGIARENFHKGPGQCEQKAILSRHLVGGSPRLHRLSPFPCGNSHRGAVFPRCCYTVALEGGWRGLSGRFPSGEQYPSCPATDPWWETSGHVTAHSTAFRRGFLAPVLVPPPRQLSCFLLILKAASVKPAAPLPCTLMLQKQTNEMSCGTWAGDPWFAGGLASGTQRPQNTLVQTK